MNICQSHGLKYSSNVLLPLAAELRPARRSPYLTEIPIYYMDHWDIGRSATGFQIEALGLDAPGLKVFDFHPNLIFINAQSAAHYAQTKGAYHDPERLIGMRSRGRGVQTLFLELLDHVARLDEPPVLMRDILGEG